MSFFHEVTAELAGKRLDTALVELEPDISRAQARRLIESGDVTVGDAPSKPAHRLQIGERIYGCVPEPEPSDVLPEDIALVILHEDRDLIVIDKPAGLVVHPAVGHRSGTLVNALLHHCEGLSGVGGVTRPGIVHRLDKGTSGVLVAAKNDLTHRALSVQFKQHTIEREYLALVRGAPKADNGFIDAPIARHPTERKRFTTRTGAGRAARTHWTVEERLGEHCLLRVRLETGRTHQIRVHLSSVGLPLVGDPVYGSARLRSDAGALERQALHAFLLGFEHPRSGERLRFQAGLPADLSRLIASLRT